MKKCIKLSILLVGLFCFFTWNNVNAQDFTSGTYYYNYNNITNGFDIPTSWSSSTMSLGSSTLTIPNGSRTNSWYLRSDWYSFNMNFVNGHSYKVSTVYQIQPYSLNGSYDMRLVGANLRYTSIGNYIANYDGRADIDSVSQTINYTDLTYNGCNGNYCTWTNTFAFTANRNASSIVLTHGGTNINQQNKFMFNYNGNGSSNVPEQLKISTLWVSIDDLGGGTDLGPMVSQQQQSNSFLQKIKDKLFEFKESFDNKVDTLNSTAQSILQNMGQSISGFVENIKEKVSDLFDFFTNNVLGLNEIDDTLQDWVDSFDNNIVMQDIHDFLMSPINLLNNLKNPTPGARCQNLDIIVFSKNISIPSGCFFWQRQDVQSFRNFWNWLFGGYLIFRLGFKYFKILHNAFDPTKDDLGGLNI